jgi:hypothetical protein
MGYEKVCERSLEDLAKFWREAAGALNWDAPWLRVLDDSDPPSRRWFTGACLNTCFNSVDSHVLEGRGEQTAVIYESSSLELVVASPITNFRLSSALDSMAPAPNETRRVFLGVN